jgi:hypothetical protein
VCHAPGRYRGAGAIYVKVRAYAHWRCPVNAALYAAARVTVSDVYQDPRKPGPPYAVTIRYGRTASLVEVHRFPTPRMAEEAAAMIREHGLASSAWPTHFRP